MDEDHSYGQLGINTEHLKGSLGEFPGSDTDWLSLEAMMLEHWRRQHRKVEVERCSTAWFDYRMLHPALRAHVFYAEYKAAFFRIREKYLLKKGRLPYANLLCEKPRVISMFISAMHVADELSMPYNYFFDGTMDYILQHEGYRTTWERSDYIAQFDVPPINLLTRGKALMHARECFDKTNARKLTLPLHKTFQVTNWVGTELQREFSNWIMNEARRRGENLPFALKALVLRGYLNEREILRKFGADMVVRVRDITE